MKTKLIPFDIEKAKNGAKVVTRIGKPVRVGFYDVKNENYPILCLVEEDNGREHSWGYTKNGKYHKDEIDSPYDLFIEEEAEETDDYNPYKTTVESIADMVERYSELQSIEELKDFYNNVRVECQDAFDYGKVCMINQDEEPADNKPKFKVGDWVIDIDKQGVVHQITNVIKNVANHTYGYNAETYTYGVFGYSYFSKNVKSMRLWDIKDAKDGDVLTSGEVIFIFNRIKGEWIHCCCTLHNGSFVSENYDLMHIKHCKEVHPATKEQRDFLFQKMKDAGYEWDKEKKELKKIEEVKTRSMTNKELADWLRKCPEEFREFTFKDGTGWICSYLDYLDSEADEPAKKDKLIRRNHGEWQEPLIEEMED